MFLKTTQHLINLSQITYIKHRMDQPGNERLDIHFAVPVKQAATENDGDSLTLRREDAIALWQFLLSLGDTVNLS